MHHTILFMRNSVSAGVGLFISSSIILLGAGSFFPGTLHSDTEAASVEDLSPVLALPLITGTVNTASAPDEVVVEASKHSAPPARTATPIAGVEPITPSRIFIPAIGINSPVIGVGTNAKGEMDVPDGTTDNVGWYKHGVKPGAVGTAVFDAHVFAAFENLAKTSVGDDIYVSAADGTQLHYRVTRVATYKLDSLSPATLFAESVSRDINLITCAGAFIKSIGTYDHRIIVSATLVQ